MVNKAMSNYEDTGIIHDVKRMYLHSYWDPIVADYTKGLIPEKYFYMFKIGKQKRKEKIITLGILHLHLLYWVDHQVHSPLTVQGAK